MHLTEKKQLWPIYPGLPREHRDWSLDLPRTPTEEHMVVTLVQEAIGLSAKAWPELPSCPTCTAEFLDACRVIDIPQNVEQPSAHFKWLSV